MNPNPARETPRGRFGNAAHGSDRYHASVPPGRTPAHLDPGEPLSRGRFRSVFLAPPGASGVDGEDGPVVIKRFHHPGGLRRLRDGVRARREFRLLAHLLAAGVRVPRPLRLVDSRPTWDVHMQAVPDATPLERLFEAGAEPVGGWGALLADLGLQLARVQAARVRLRDLGPKNVLVDGAGRPWCIDFHDARLRRRDLTRAEALAEVRTAAAAARDFLPARLRLRFLARWRNAAGVREPPGPFGPLELGALEEAARQERRATVAKGIGRWLRDSSRCSVNGTTLTRRGRAPGQVACETALPFEEARQRWLCAARLLEHGLPVVRPGELARAGARARISLDVPRNWSSEARLRELLHDRGLALDSWKDALLVGEAGVALKAPLRLLEG